MTDPLAYTLPTCDDPPQVMGILNVTPDSFSDGGRYGGIDAAVAHGLRMAREGAAVIDVGGESTRPGAQRVPPSEQQRRVVGVIQALRSALDAGGFERVAVSIDTTRASVAEAALDAGASVLNDVSAGVEDAGMFALAAGRGVPIVLMHMQGSPGTMQDAPVYGDVVGEVVAFLVERARAAESAGVARERIAIDPGIGFGKTLAHNLSLLASLGRLVATGYPVLLGASRKRFIEAAQAAAGVTTSGGQTGADRLGGTVATTVLGCRAGVRVFRVHDVFENRQALNIARAVGDIGRDC